MNVLNAVHVINKKNITQLPVFSNIIENNQIHPLHRLIRQTA